jgi:hypothetical protein
MKMDVLINECEWVDAQKNGFVPVYNDDCNRLYFEKPGILITGFCPCGPIYERGQQYVRVYDGQRSTYYKTITLYWHFNYAGKCPECGGVMEKFETLADGVDDTEFEVEQCFDCGYYE